MTEEEYTKLLKIRNSLRIQVENIDEMLNKAYYTGIDKREDYSHDSVFYDSMKHGK